MRHSLLRSSIVGFLAAWSISAQGAAPPAERPATHSATLSEPLPPPPLSGPRVDVSHAPGAAMSFAGEQGGMQRANLRQYIAILRDLDLNEAQRADAERIVGEHTQAVRAYQQEHAAEQRQLRRTAAAGAERSDARRSDAAPASDRRPPLREGDEARPGRPGDRAMERGTDRPMERPADRPAEARDRAEPEPPSPEALKAGNEARMRLEEIRRGAPPQEPVMKRLYDLLTPEQQTAFDARIEEMRQTQMAEQLRRRLIAAGVDPEAMQDMQMQGQMQGMQMRPGDDGTQPMVDVDESQLSPEMLQRLRRLREERRRMLANRQRRNPVPPTPDEIEFEQPQE